jgi:hypothetical protein
MITPPSRPMPMFSDITSAATLNGRKIDAFNLSLSSVIGGTRARHFRLELRQGCPPGSSGS